MVDELLDFFVIVIPFFGWHPEIHHDWLWKVDIVQLLVRILLQIRSLFVASLVQLIAGHAKFCEMTFCLQCALMCGSICDSQAQNNLFNRLLQMENAFERPFKFEEIVLAKI